jgi:hypothetical protein
VASLTVLALIDAKLGNKEKAIQEGRTACDMLPPTKDAALGVLLITNPARIYARIGEENLALERLDYSEQASTRAVLWTAPSRSLVGRSARRPAL